MATALSRSGGQIARSRGIGCRVGTLIGAGWLAYGLSTLPNSIRVPGGLIGIVAVVFLLRSSRHLIAMSRSLPPATAAEQAAGRRTWRWFWLNLVAEIVLLNVAINLLAQPALHIYWIPAISLVVGLHFLPMARFFEVPSYWVCAGVMMGVAALTVIALRTSMVSPTTLAASEGIMNALILWATAAWSLRTATRPMG